MNPKEVNKLPKTLCKYCVRCSLFYECRITGAVGTEPCYERDTLDCDVYASGDADSHLIPLKEEK